MGYLGPLFCGNLSFRQEQMQDAGSYETRSAAAILGWGCVPERWMHGASGLSSGPYCRASFLIVVVVAVAVDVAVGNALASPGTKVVESNDKQAFVFAVLLQLLMTLS